MALEYVQEGVVVCDATGEMIFHNASANYLGVASSGVLAEQAITEALELALQGESPEDTLELFLPAPWLGDPGVSAHSRRRSVRGGRDHPGRLRSSSCGGHPADFVANVSHELKTPVGALSLLAETLDGEDDPEVVERLANASPPKPNGWVASSTTCSTSPGSRPTKRPGRTRWSP